MVGIVNQRINEEKRVRIDSLLMRVFCWMILLLPGLCFAQSVTDKSIEGKPRVLHYNRKDFDGDPQIWAMCQDKHSILYFGSNNGTLIFDGEKWQKVPLPNNSSVRSLFVSGDGTVYAGGFNEFGKIRKDEFGKYVYESMLGVLRNEDRNIENIWAIHEVQGNIVFRSYRYIIAVQNSKAVVVPSQNGVFDYSSVVDNKLFVFDGEGLKTLDIQSLDFSIILDGKKFGDETFLTLLPGFSDGDMLTLTRQGTFAKLDRKTNTIEFVQKLNGYDANNRINCAIKSSSGNYYLGTLTTKVVSLSSMGAVTDANFFSDLQDNTVHNLFESAQGNIWALLNNGIDCIDVSSPVSQVFDNASVADVQEHEGRIYLATNQGVFFAQRKGQKLSRPSFRNLDGLEGQAWSLQIIEQQVLCGHDQGVMVLNDNGYTRVAGPRGVWKIIPVNEKPGHYLVCTYEGMHLMRYTPSAGFQILHKLQGFNESSRDILQAEQPGVFWVCHGYKGVFKIKIDPAYVRIVGVEHFRDKNGFPSPFNINVFAWNKQIVFTTNHGIFKYDEASNRFTLHEQLTNIFGTEKNVRQISQHGSRTWFAHDDEIGYFDSPEGNPDLHKGLFLQLKASLNQSMECIVPVNESNVLIGTREGLYSFNLDYRPSSQEKTLITRARSKQDGDSGGEVFLPLSGREKAEIPNNTSTLRFDFAVPGFDDKLNIQYSYRIEEINSTWSEWQETPYVEYTLLPAGQYTFRVKARSLLGENADEATYSFRIIPVWYQTPLAYTLYLLITLIIVYFVVKMIQRRIDAVRRKTIAEEEEKRKILQLEIDHIKLERERAEIIKDKAILEEDVIFKSKELANYTMLLVKKRELLAEMQEKLTDLKEIVKNDQARSYIRELLKMIGVNLQSEEHLKVFEANFERVHHQFFASLKTSFPDLTNKELQLCAFVKMNLSNKEIASILNLSVRGIETARYRLRKRLNITHEEDMAAFLEKLHSGQDIVPEIKN
jgi:AraC family transcriptional regulator, chitin signaling transcriptional activator